MSQWHYDHAGQQAGPVTQVELRNMLNTGQLSVDDMVWTEGMDDWQPARSVRHMLVDSSISSDPGPFLHIGSEFAIGGSRWAGRVLASPEALYLRKDGQPSGARNVVAALVHAATVSYDGTRTCIVAELPLAVRDVMNANGLMGGKDVVVVPRESVSMVRTSKLNNAVVVKAGDAEFLLMTAVWRMFKVPRVLAEMGWKLNQELVPTVAAQHDTRTTEERAAAEKRNASILKRVLYWVIAILLVAGLVALKLYLDDH